MFSNVNFFFAGSFTSVVFIFGEVFLYFLIGKVTKPPGEENLRFFFYFCVLFLVLSITESDAGIIKMSRSFFLGRFLPDFLSCFVLTSFGETS